MPVEGQIALAARGYLPQTWDSLANSTFYGEALLDSKQNYIKFTLFGTVVNPSLELSLYNPLVTEYAAKNLAISIIPAGADYYGGKMIAITSTGTNESKTYPDRIGMLWRTHARLLQEIQDMLPQVQQYIPDANLKRLSSVPSNSGRGKQFLTTDPQLFYPSSRWAGATANHRGHLPWTEWI